VKFEQRSEDMKLQVVGNSKISFQRKGLKSGKVMKQKLVGKIINL
jgi:hypothetical protein